MGYFCTVMRGGLCKIRIRKGRCRGAVLLECQSGVVADQDDIGAGVAQRNQRLIFGTVVPSA